MSLTYTWALFFSLAYHTWYLMNRKDTIMLQAIFAMFAGIGTMLFMDYIITEFLIRRDKKNKEKQINY